MADARAPLQQVSPLVHSKLSPRGSGGTLHALGRDSIPSASRSWRRWVGTDLIVGGTLLLVAAVASHFRATPPRGPAEIVGTWRGAEGEPADVLVILPDFRVRRGSDEGTWQELPPGVARSRGGYSFRVSIDDGAAWTATVRDGVLVTVAQERERRWVRSPR